MSTCSSKMLRDKDYIITQEGLVFNVIGYEHPPGRTTANLKYVSGKKWDYGYPKAVAFLGSNYPEYLYNGFISVPDKSVGQIFEPKEGLLRLSGEKEPNERQRLAVELAGVLSRHFGVPLGKWGITDSLLWGPGTPNSDIDLVVYGKKAVSAVQAKLQRLFERRDFWGFGHSVFQRPDALSQGDFRRICARKLNFGYYKGVKFSLRAAREWDEIGMAKLSYKELGLKETEAMITESSESLFFPAIYGIESGVARELVCYSNTYENVFRRGDEVGISGTLERVSDGRDSWRRLVIGTLKNLDREYITI